MTLTPAMEMVVEDLTDRVRAMDRPQVLTVVSAGELDRLLRRGLLEEWRAVARARLPAARPPLHVWRRGDPAPPFAHLSWLAERRWACAGMVPTTYYVASDFARKAFGGHSMPPSDDQLSHDLEVAALFVRCRREFPGLAPFWVGEDRRKRGLAWGEKLPDAVFGEGEVHHLAWEFLGLYPAARIRSFHQELSGEGPPNRPLPYVLY